MWPVDPVRLMAHLKGAGGENLAQFVDSLIRAEAHIGGLPQAKIHTQVRQNVRDGGVDTRVEAAVPHDASGWLGTATCWQYKAQQAVTPKDLSTELRKNHAQDLIRKGYAYRLCIAGDLPDEKRVKWEQCLSNAARNVCPSGPPPRVVAVDKIAAWAGRFPMIARDFNGIPRDVWSIETWGNNITAVTPSYYPGH